MKSTTPFRLITLYWVAEGTVIHKHARNISTSATQKSRVFYSRRLQLDVDCAQATSAFEEAHPDVLNVQGDLQALGSEELETCVTNSIMESSYQGFISGENMEVDVTCSLNVIELSGGQAVYDNMVIGCAEANGLFVVAEMSYRCSYADAYITAEMDFHFANVPGCLPRDSCDLDTMAQEMEQNFIPEGIVCSADVQITGNDDLDVLQDALIQKCDQATKEAFRGNIVLSKAEDAAEAIMSGVIESCAETTEAAYSGAQDPPDEGVTCSGDMDGTPEFAALVQACLVSDNSIVAVYNVTFDFNTSNVPMTVELHNIPVCLLNKTVEPACEPEIYTRRFRYTSSSGMEGSVLQEYVYSSYDAAASSPDVETVSGDSDRGNDENSTASDADGSTTTGNSVPSGGGSSNDGWMADLADHGSSASGTSDEDTSSGGNFQVGFLVPYALVFGLIAALPHGL
jgi:hypothetical protein